MHKVPPVHSMFHHPASRGLLVTVAVQVMAIVATGSALADEPKSLDAGLRQMSDEIADVIKQHKFERVAVIEFIHQMPVRNSFGSGLSLLGLSCAEDLEQKLSQADGGCFRVVTRRQLRRQLAGRGLTIDELQNTEALRPLVEGPDGVAAIVVGKLSQLHGRRLTIDYRLIETESGSEVLHSTVTVVLDYADWAMSGRSVAILPGDPPAVDAQSEVPDADDELFDLLEQRSSGPHPLSDPKFPLRLKMMIGGKERVGVFRGNDYVIPVSSGEVFEIWGENRSGAPVYMRLLVDGVSTLPEKEIDRHGISRVVSRKCVRLNNCRPWIIDNNRHKLFALRGFVVGTDRDYQIEPFVVGEMNTSFVLRQEFTAEPGIITAAFYTDVPNRREAYDIEVPRKLDNLKLRAVIQLRCEDALRHADECN
jgi:hypothetical protein